MVGAGGLLLLISSGPLGTIVPVAIFGLYTLSAGLKHTHTRLKTTKTKPNKQQHPANFNEAMQNMCILFSVSVFGSPCYNRTG